MTTNPASRRTGPRRTIVRRVVFAAAAVVLAVAMFLNTKILSTEEASGAGQQKFSAGEYAAENYADLIKPTIVENAVPAAELAVALEAGVDAAGDEFGGRDGQSAWAFPVSFTGVAGEVAAVTGQLPVAVEGLPEGIEVFVQMGPAVNGSALRDVTGELSFGMFTNQLEFQSVAVELNNQVKSELLADFDAAELAGQTISVVGAFSYVNPEAWIVTPVQIDVAG